MLEREASRYFDCSHDKERCKYYFMLLITDVNFHNRITMFHNWLHVAIDLNFDPEADYDKLVTTWRTIGWSCWSDVVARESLKFNL
jgi:hypothetical protein